MIEKHGFVLKIHLFNMIDEIRRLQRELDAAREMLRAGAGEPR